MAIAVVQSLSGQGTGTTVTASGSLTTSGNILVACIRSGNNTAITLPTGWTTFVNAHASTYGAYNFAWARVRDIGPATSYAFTVGSGANAIQIYELSGADEIGMSFWVSGGVLAETTAVISYASIGQPKGTMLPPNYQALSFISGITATNGGTITPTFTGTFTTDSLVSGSNNCWIQPYHSTSPITVNSSVGLSAATLGTANAGIALNLLIGQAPSGLMIGRSVGVNNTGGSASPAFTLPGGNPCEGNLILVHVFGQASSNGTFNTPIGWTILDNEGNTTSTGPPLVATLYRVVQSGDTSAYTFTSAFSVAQDYNIWAVEIYGQSQGSPINGHSYVQVGSSSAALTLPSVTPSVSGCLGISMATEKTTAPTLPAGWTSQYTATNSGSAQVINAAYQSGLGTGAYAPSWQSSATNAAAAMVIVSPSTYPTSPYYVQTPSTFIHGQSAGPVTYSFTKSPALGNLIWLVLYTFSSAATSITPPTGWTQLTQTTNANGNNISIYWRQATSSDVSTPSYAFSFSNASTYYCVTGFEVSGGNPTSPINKSTLNTYPTAGATQTSPSLTPSLYKCLPFAAFGQGSNTTTPTNPTAGLYQANNLVSISLNSQFGPLLNNETPIAATITYSNSQSSVATSFILMAPLDLATATANASADVLRTTTLTAAASADILAIGSLTAGASATVRVENPGTLTANASADILQGSAAAAGASANITSIASQTAAGHANVAAKGAQATAAHADILATGSATSLASADVLAKSTLTAGAHAEIKEAATFTTTASADVQAAGVKTASASGNVLAKGSKTAAASADLLVLASLTSLASADLFAPAEFEANAHAVVYRLPILGPAAFAQAPQTMAGYSGKNVFIDLPIRGVISLIMPIPRRRGPQSTLPNGGP